MARAVKPKDVVIYSDTEGNSPFSVWLEGLKDIKTRQRILARLRRLEQGNFGDCQPIGNGLSELRLFFGPGYRVYFGEEGGHIVIILCGGDKSSQKKDITLAKAYWKEHKDNEQT
jgi:putative addiction module killer protein